VGWGKNSLGWHYGFKLHLIINDQGELLAFKLTPGNVDARQPVPDLTKDLIGKLCRRSGYISQELFEKLYEQGLELITSRCLLGSASSAPRRHRSKKNMKQKLINWTVRSSNVTSCHQRVSARSTSERQSAGSYGL